MKWLRSNWRYILLMALAVVLAAWGVHKSYEVWTLKQGEKTTVGPLTVVKPDHTIKSAVVDDKGDLILTYKDGSTSNAGHVVGPRGDTGSTLGPTDSQVAAAVATYCANGNCDGKAPTPEQVATAVSDYCANNACKGADGKSVTPDMVMAAVASYCANGACVGPAGATGPTGKDGRTTQMACVIRTTNNIATQYVAWKYTDEADSAYRDLYKLPVWAQGSNCVDLTT